MEDNVGQSVKRTALVVYGSETGNSQDVAEELGRLAERLRFTAIVSDLNSIEPRNLIQHDVVLIAISTTGQGDIPANASNFWRALRSVRLRPGCLQSMRFASFGLGDSSYPKFNWAHRKLYNRLVQLGGQPICDRGEADEQHPEGLDATFLPWCLNLRQHLLERYPLPDGIEPIPDTVLLEPKWVLDFVTPGGLTHTQPATNGVSNGINGDQLDHVHQSSSGKTEHHSMVFSLPSEELMPIPGSHTATLLANARITPETHWQDVRHLTFSLPNHVPYAPGDVLTIYPKNFPEDVNEFINIMSWSSIADKPLRFLPTSNVTEEPYYPPPPIRNLSPDGTLTIRSLLTNYLDIMSIPRRSFFSLIAHFTEDTFQKDRLLEFTNPEYIDELYDYTTRPRRSILEVLQEFETVKIPWQRLTGIIPLMRGRQFSIASGGLLKQPAPQSQSAEAQEAGAAETRIELLVAIVKYRTVIKRIRQGVCTRYIASLRPGQKLNVTLARGGLDISKAERHLPVVMIGPGTGVAPMRSMTYERLAWRTDATLVDRRTTEKDKPLQGDLLFFGCRNENADYFFKDEWQRLQPEAGLQVFAAFSRDQRQKIYVQDVLRNHSRKVYEALGQRNGLVYICGSSGKTPQAVREALVEVFQKEGRLTRESAEAYLMKMEKEGRYKQETW